MQPYCKWKEYFANCPRLRGKGNSSKDPLFRLIKHVLMILKLGCGIAIAQLFFYNKKIIIMSKIKTIVFISFILTAFLQIQNIALWDNDFWWHIATGKYMVTEKSLMEKDVFSYTSSMKENDNLFPERENFILKQYWLGQIIFYLIYEYTGPRGIIIFRTLLYIGTMLFVFWRLKRWSVSAPVAYIATFVVFMAMMSKITGERPVLFTILFTAVTFFLLEDFKDKKDKRIFLLLPLMLLWANLHGGFILGVVMVMVYMISEGINIRFKKNYYTRQQMILFYAAAIAAIALSAVNPTGWDAFSIAFSSQYKPFIDGIQEYQSPLISYREKFTEVNYWYMTLAALFPIILAVRNKKMDLAQVILLSGFLIMGIIAARFGVYYVIIATIVIGREFDAWLKELFHSRFSEQAYIKFTNLLTIITLCSLLVYIGSFFQFNRNTAIVARGFSVPVNAVDFIEKNNLEGNMLNDFGYGGYITWRLYPSRKTFIDTRALNLTVMTEFHWMVATVNSIYGNEPSQSKGPLWERLLDHYDINFIFLALHDVFGSPLQLNLKLAESDKWVPVYCDPISIIFVRNIEKNRKIINEFKLTKDEIYNVMIFSSTKYALSNSVNPRSLIALGQIFYQMGRLNEALTAYEYAMKRLPRQDIEDKINEIKSEIEAKKGSVK